MFPCLSGGIIPGTGRAPRVTGQPSVQSLEEKGVMNSERWQQVERLYRSALEHEPARRGAFLAEACEGDEELRSEVESLLSHEESAGVVIEPPSAEGRTISQYQILEKIGEGGMGRVYKARDLKLDRPVALKFLAPRLLASADARSRFLREARALSALNHPHIATIFDVEEVESEPFLVLEYLPGGTLQSKMRRLAADGRKLSASQILEYGMQIAEGLAHAHRHDIVHRDVKTGNVLLSAEGSLKITDFGLAKFRGGEHVTRPGSMLGTAAYMSPEQARGREVDHRSDIFSFGIVLYEIAAAELPFKGDHEQAVVHQILNESPRPLHEVRPDLPRDFEALVERALQKDPERRYQRMEQMLEELSRLRREVDTGGEAASRRFTVTLPWGARRRGTSIRWLAAATLLLAALVSAVMVLPGVRRTLLQLVPYFQAQKERHLAVLPFANVGGDPENQAFCDGVVESLTSSLTQLERFQGSLLVVPASEVRRQSVASVRDAQRSFGVNLAVTGSVQRTAGGVRLTVNLNDARTLLQLGARAVDVPREELSKMEDRLLNLVAELLEMQLQPQARSALSAGSTSVSDAYDAYLQGRGYLQRYDKPGNVERAISVFQEALKRDPHYALAYAGLGEAYLRSFGRDKDPHWLELAQGAGARAVELNGQLAPAHVNLGMVYAATGRLEKAVGEFKIALDLDPISVAAYRELAGAYEAQNKMKDAEDTYKRAIQLRPEDWVSNGLLGTFFYRHGRYTEAEPLFRKIIELTPDNFNGYLNLGGLYTMLGRYEEAEPPAEEIQRGAAHVQSLLEPGHSVLPARPLSRGGEHVREGRGIGGRRQSCGGGKPGGLVPLGAWTGAEGPAGLPARDRAGRAATRHQSRRCHGLEPPGGLPRRSGRKGPGLKRHQARPETRSG